MLKLSKTLLVAVTMMAPVTGVAQPAPLPVVATIGMISDLAAEVGGECVAVSTLVPAGADPHLFRPRPSDLGLLQDAQVILHLGLNLEGRLGDVLDSLYKQKSVVELAVAFAPDQLLVEDGAPDPHLWMDPVLWAQVLPVMQAQFALARPDCADAMADRAAQVETRLRALDGWVRASMASVPETARVLVTAHDAFGYYARAYGLQQAALQGFSTESEASIADLRAVVEVLRSAGVPTVFAETTINPRSIQALAEAAQAQGHSVALGEPLYSDAMGAPGTPEGSYIGMIRANTLAIVAGLGGQPAPWPEALSDWAAAWGVVP